MVLKTTKRTPSMFHFRIRKLFHKAKYETLEEKTRVFRCLKSSFYYLGISSFWINVFFFVEIQTWIGPQNACSSSREFKQSLQKLMKFWHFSENLLTFWLYCEKVSRWLSYLYQWFTNYLKLKGETLYIYIF